MPKKIYRLVFSGGGSGGHLTPSIAIAKQLEKNNQILFICSKNILDSSILEKTNFKFKVISTGKLRRYFSWQNFADLYQFIKGIAEAVLILKTFQADLVFSKGGFVSLPVALAAFVLKIPIIAHESDAVPGLATKVISKFAKKVCHTFPINDKKCLWTGTPIRPEIISADLKIGKNFLGFLENKPIVLFMGSSQGAVEINNICKLVFKNLKKYANVVLLAGKNKLIHLQDDSFREYEFLHEDFASVLKSAAIVISRASASSLFELAALSKPSIILPLNSAANNHQRKNAEFFAHKEAIYLVKSSSEVLIAREVQDIIIKWILEPKEKEKYQINIKKFFQAEASKKIAQIILKECQYDPY